MSYILDALKKLEKERRRGRIPGLSEQDSIVYHSQRRPVWPYILITVIVLNATLALWWFLPKRPQVTVMPEAPASLPLAAPSNLPLSTPSARTPLWGGSQDVKMPEIKESGNVNSSGAAESSHRPATPSAKDTDYHERLLSLRKKMQEDAQKKTDPMNSEPKADHEKQKKTETASPEKKPEAVAEPLPDKKLYKLSELPPSVRESLQKFFTITAYMYSNTPSERKVRINDHMMKEGQELDPGIRIEEIVPDGVILSYRKFRFFVSLK